MTDRLELNRRQFVVTTAAAGGGMALGVTLPPVGGALAQAAITEMNPWILINADDTVVLRLPNHHQGNGGTLNGATFICEELSCAWEKVSTVYADPQRNALQNKVYQQFGQSARSLRAVAQQAGASARERLKAAAAARLNVPVAEVEAKEGRLIHARSNRTLRYGEVAAQAALIKLEKEPAIKKPEEWTFAGKMDHGKLETKQIVNGSAIFGSDVRLPNMLYAAVMQSPVHGGTLKSYDFNAIKDRPGVRAAVSIDKTPDPSKLGGNTRSFLQSAVAVVADTWWQAKTALEVMPIQWDDGPGAKYTTTEVLYKEYMDGTEKPAKSTIRSKGDPALAGGLKQPGPLVEAKYLSPFQEHFLIEPMNATAQVRPDRLDIWGSVGASGENSYLIGMDELKLTADKVFYHDTLSGGSFGRRNGGEEVRLAVAIAKQMTGPLAGRPVKMLWSREETSRQGTYRPLAAIKMQAKLGADGYPTHWFMRQTTKSRQKQWGQPMAKVEQGEVDSLANTGMIDAPYWEAVPNMRYEWNEMADPYIIGSFRSPGWNTNMFFLESFIDEMAAAAKIDELEYRRKLLAPWHANKDKGWLQCLNDVADKSGWGKKTLPKGTAQGIAVGCWSSSAPGTGTIVANVVTLSLTKGGEVKLEDVHVSFDPGYIVNPNVVRNNVESGTMWYLSNVLYHEVNLRNGRVVEGNFDDGQMLRIAEAPRVHVSFDGFTGMPGGANPGKFVGVSEPQGCLTQSAITTAIAKITGKRIRQLPLKNYDLSWT